MAARRAVRQSLITATTILIAAVAPSAIAQRPTRVLLLFQQQAETAPMVEFIQPLRREVLRGLKDPAEFYQESLDLDRFAGRERWSELKTFLENKYRGFGIDVVVPVGGRALQFATDQLADVLPGVPIVFALCAAPQTDPATLPPNVTGRLGVASRFAPTFDMARRLQPNAEQVVIIGGSGDAESSAVNAALDAVSGTEKTFRVSLLVGLSLDTLLTRLHRLPRRSIVLFANFRRDALGQVFEPLDLIGTMAHASAAPIYTQLYSYVGEGVVGGWVIKFDDEGARTGRLIRRVLGRRPGEPMPAVELLAKTFVADWRALRRWGLDESRLPPGTEVLFREPSLWTRYRTAVLVTLVVFAMLLGLIGLLLVERQRRKRAQMALQEQSAYEQTIARLTTDAVRHAPDDAPQALEDALARIAEYAGARSATLIQCPDTAVGTPVRLAWAVPTNGWSRHLRSPGSPLPETTKATRLEIPLVADGAPVGTLELHRDDGGGWPATLIRRLESAGEVIASAMARSRAIRTVRRGEELNRAVLASISTLIAIIDKNGTIIRVNAAWRRVATAGVGDAARESFVGSNYLDECRNAELRGCDVAREVRYGIEGVLERRAWPFRYEYRCADPKERWYELFVDQLQLSEGGAIITHLDITDRRLAERRAEETRRQVAHMGRMAFVGELAATISHELRQPLAAIRVNAEAGAQLLAANPADASEAREIFQNIVADDARAVELIESVRKLLRKETAAVATVDLNKVCRDAVRLLQHDAVLRGTKLELVLASEPPLVTGDGVQLQQVVLNLALNGLEAAGASPSERSVVVATECGGDHVDLLVRDSGPGIPSGVQPHLFESFFSTKTEGLGLGLVIVRSIVERHNGRVLVENAPTGGAVFRVRFPAAAGTPALPDRHATNEKQRR
ncbi:MAG TPA: ATP-binding protein [Gemmatimonadaceae bacterium]|nr:ATP-binding protein [Gemmatimonadaceae bacterium]